MINIRNVAELKRTLEVGQNWECTAFYPDGTFKFSLGIRPLASKSTVQFGFMTDRGTVSYCDYPKASEFQPIENGFRVVKSDFITLEYKHRN